MQLASAHGYVLVCLSGSSVNPVVCFLMEASLQRHDRLNHWPLVTDSPCPPSQEVRGLSLNFNPVITRLVLQPPSLESFVSHLINVTTETFTVLMLKKSQEQLCASY